MSSKKMNFGSKDLISNLPEALIGHILSFLPTRHAALTSILSKRWRYLLAFVPNLDFDDEVYNYCKMSQLKRLEKCTSFQVFVDRVMALQGNASVNKFSLRCELGVERSSSLDRWLSNVLERGVVDLDLYVPVEYSYQLPSEVLMSKTLVKLKVEGTNHFSTDVGQVFLPKLKILHLLDVVFNDEGGAAFSKLISGCHVLEELVMMDVVFYYCDFFLVSIPTLKRLEVRLDFTDQKQKNVSFDTPNLVYLEFTDTVGVKYPKVNFDSLVEANLDLRMRNYHNEPVGDATNLFMGICNIEILYLSSTTLEVLTFCCKAIPIFSNLIHLTIVTHNKEVQWELLPKLLENCPNLETLVFKELHYKDRINCKPWEGTRTCLSSSPVKMLKVLEFGKIYNFKGCGMDKQKEVIKYYWRQCRILNK